jgi:hypothetical protein
MFGLIISSSKTKKSKIFIIYKFNTNTNIRRPILDNQNHMIKNFNSKLDNHLKKFPQRMYHQYTWNKNE